MKKFFILIAILFLGIPAQAEMLLTGEVELKDRTIARFSDKSYAVMFKNDQFHVRYYSENGELTHIETKDKIEYPYNFYKHDVAGNLVNKGLRISKGESFIFNPNGKLLAHWVKGNAYDEQGNVIMTREYLE